jgi:hypothetical protein
MDPKETWREDVHWIEVAQERIQWWALTQQWNEVVKVIRIFVL